ncbi:unnamed protein product [Lactuca saligna]|uniref:Uncharacterized protein n=1 Tax=Lactuca saligna TaxID=75948 RepID=A0AA35YVE6_LACSI|nr:unnamed protein product [Lactuca saligna]
MATARTLGRDLTTKERECFEFRFGFIPEHGVQISFPIASLYSPPEGKFGIPIALFEAHLHFSYHRFLQLYNPGIRVFSKGVEPYRYKQYSLFEILCHALGHFPTVLAFKHFFNASTQLGTRTLSRHRGVPTLIHDKKYKKNCKDKFLWVNNDLMVLSYRRNKVYINHAPVLFGAEKKLADALEKISITGEDWLDCFLAAGGMSATWRACGKMPELFVEI